MKSDNKEEGADKEMPETTPADVSRVALDSLYGRLVDVNRLITWGAKVWTREERIRTLRALLRIIDETSDGRVHGSRA